MDFIDFYERVRPRVRAEKSPTLWDGPEGDRARKSGIQTADEFAVFNVIAAECAKRQVRSAFISEPEIARRLKASPSGVDKIVQNLILRGALRVEPGLLGVRALAPCFK